MSKVLMIGLDGATFALLDPLMDQGLMPFLKRSIESGVRAELFSTRNPLTPPAWISMVTGREPNAHGVHDFLRPEFAKDGSIYLRVNDSRDIQVETLWSLVSRNGKRVTSLNFFGMSPPFPIDGYMISGFVPWRHLRHATHPPEFFPKLKEIEGLDYRNLGMDIGEEKKCVQGLFEGEHEAWIRLQGERDAAWARLLEHLMEQDPTELSAVVLDGPDKMQHLFWRFLDPDLLEANPSGWFTRIRGLCLDYYRELDRTLERLNALAGPDTNILLTSDHGFGPTTEVVYLNEWLSQHGHLTWKQEAEAAGAAQLTADRMRDHMAMIDWNKTHAFCPTPSSNSIFLRRDPGKAHSVGGFPYLEFCQKLRQELLDFRDPANGDPVFLEVHLNRLEGTAYTEHTPDLTVRLRDGGFVSILKGLDGTVIAPRAHADGTHRPNGIFIGWGPDVLRGQRVAPLSLLDITPLILHLLGLPVPRNLDGTVPRWVLADGGAGEASASATIRPATAAIAAGSRGEPTDEEREALLKQMKLLGYMD
jgi:predicted AlkP superfamily phosphohydrolase/phosphomutase